MIEVGVEEVRGEGVELVIKLEVVAVNESADINTRVCQKHPDDLCVL